MEMPTEAVRIGKCLKVYDVDTWFCPDCGATGNQETLDFIPLHNVQDTEMVQYCCGECFEQNLYATFTKES